MAAIASQITSLTIVYSTDYSDVDQRKHQSSVSLAFVRGIHRGPVNSPHKWPVTRKMSPFDDVIMGWVLVDFHFKHWVEAVRWKFLWIFFSFPNRKQIKTAVSWCAWKVNSFESLAWESLEKYTQHPLKVTEPEICFCPKPGVVLHQLLSYRCMSSRH